ncbi:MAG TPA: SPFH/Band 7/PHB domain protein, partial [Baekduia sp.]|nr:SPFH/Band 7/PHB domain protein [Baekduia sp.]
DPDPKLLSYQYLQMLPKIAQGDANKVWVIPSEFTAALSQATQALSGDASKEPPHGGPGPA